MDSSVFGYLLVTTLRGIYSQPIVGATHGSFLKMNVSESREESKLACFSEAWKRLAKQNQA